LLPCSRNLLLQSCILTIFGSAQLLKRLNRGSLVILGLLQIPLELVLHLLEEPKDGPTLGIIRLGFGRLRAFRHNWSFAVVLLEESSVAIRDLSEHIEQILLEGIPKVTALSLHNLKEGGSGGCIDEALSV